MEEKSRGRSPDDPIPVGRNQNKPAHIEARRKFYDDLCERIEIDGFQEVRRDHAFDDDSMRSAGIRMHYASAYELPQGVKDGVPLEAGFDQVAPNRPCTISSWAFDKAVDLKISGLTDNRAMDVLCYEPGYTLVEKLQTISTKYRRHLETGQMPQNFLRHYYDVYCLLGNVGVQEFIGTPAYLTHKDNRFPRADNQVISQNEAFTLEDPVIRRQFEVAYQQTAALYYRGQPPFEEVLDLITTHSPRL